MMMTGTTGHAPGRFAGKAALTAMLAILALLLGAGCIQDNLLIPTNTIAGRVIPTGITPPPPTTSPGSVTVTVNVTVPTVPVRLNVVGTGTNISLIQPIGPLPGTSELAFASVTGDFVLPTKKTGHVKVVARGLQYHVAWAEVVFTDFNQTMTIRDLDSVNLVFTDPLRANGSNNIVVKKPGEAAFVVFAEDFTIRGVPVRSVRIVIDPVATDPNFSTPAVGFNIPDDGSLDAQTDRNGIDPVSFDLAPGDGVFTRVFTGFSAGEHTYGFVINNDDIIRRDPYEEFSNVVIATRRSGILVK